MRDLIIVPASEYDSLALPDVLNRLFGKHLPASVRSNIVLDRRQRFLRIQPIHFTAIKRALRQQEIPFTVAFDERPALPFTTTLAMEPRPYQLEALGSWLAEGSAGVVVLPTGAGKTFTAAMVIHETGLWTLAVVPTIDLLQQWRAALSAALALDVEQIGLFGGGEKELKPITIITYDSAALYPRELRNFGLLIFDECHHLPAPTYRLIAESAFTPLRLGLSATPERSDMAHSLSTLSG